MNKTIRRVIPEVLRIGFLVLISLLPFVWLAEPNSMIAGQDVGYPFNPIEYLLDRLTVWVPSLGFGVHIQGWIGFITMIAFEALVTFLVRSVTLGEKLVATIWFFLPMLAMYVAAKQILNHTRLRWAPWFAAILYGFNLFQMQGWGVFWRSRFSIYTLLPLVYMLLTDYYGKKRSVWITSSGIVLLLFIFNGGGSPPLYGAVLLLGFLVTSYYAVRGVIQQQWGVVQKTISLMVVTVILFTLTSFYWIFPYFNFVTGQYTAAVEGLGGPTGVIGWTKVLTRNASILNLIRLSGFDFLEAGTEYGFALTYLRNPWFIIASYAFPLLAVSAVLLHIRTRLAPVIRPLFLLSVFSLPFIAGAHEPFLGFFTFLLNHVPGYAIFRTTIYKFGGVLWFSYALLIGICLDTIVMKAGESVKKVWRPLITAVAVIIFLAFVGWYNRPFIMGQIFHWKPPLSTLVRVPDYVFSFGTWLDTHAASYGGRTLLLPEMNKNWRSVAYTWRYWSLATVFSQLTRHNTITNDMPGDTTEGAIVDTLYALLKKNDSYWRTLAGIIGVRNFILQDDTDWNLSWAPTTSPELYRQIAENNGFRQLYMDGKWTMYEDDGIRSLPKVYASTDMIRAKGNNKDIVDIFRQAAWNISNPPVITFNQPDISSGVFPVSRTYIQTRCIYCDPSQFAAEVSSVEFPGSTIVPGSVLYPFIRWRERRILQPKHSAGSKIDANISFAGKRLTELKSIRQTESGSLIRTNTDLYGRHMKSAAELIKDVPETDRNMYAIRMLVYLHAQEQYVRRELNGIPREHTDTLIKSIREYISGIEEYVWISSGDAKFKYEIQTEQKEYLPVVVGLDDYSLLLNGSEVKSDQYIPAEKGVLRFELDTGTPENLIEQAHNEGEHQLLPGEISEIESKPLAPGEPYYLNINYAVRLGDTVRLTLYEKNQLSDKRSVYSSDLNGDLRETQFTYTHTPSRDGTLVLEFRSGQSERNPAQITISDVSLEQVRSARIWLSESGDTTGKSGTPPRLSFLRISPVRISVGVQDATVPFVLHFGEKFDPNWKLYRSASAPGNSDACSDVWYNRVCELPSAGNLWDIKYFLGREPKPIAGDSHFVSNGYGNGWIVDSPGTYDLYIAHNGQRQVVQGIVVTLVSIIGVAVILLYGSKRKARNT